MNDRKKKQNQIIKVTALLGLFLLVFGISYALFSVVLEGTKKNRISTANFGLILTDKDGVEEKNLPEGTMAINLENAVPMSTQEAIDTVEPYEFIIENTGDIDVDYELYIDVDSNSTLAPSFIKYNLIQTDMTGISEVISLYDYNLPELSDEKTDDLASLKMMHMSRLLVNTKITKDGKTLYKLDLGTIPSKQKYKYSLKMWVAYAASNSAMNKTFEGKLKIYGTQTTKDSTYVVEKVDLTSYQGEREGAGKLFAKRYSDNSLRIEGFGIVPDSIEENLDFTRLVENSRFTDDLISDINTALAKDGIDPYNDLVDYSLDAENLNLSEGVSNEFDSILNNIDSYHKYNTLYIGEGITGIQGHVFDGIVFNYSAFDKIYVSKTVNDIGGFGLNDYLKEVEFVELKNPGYQVFAENGLIIDAYTFVSCSSLTNVHILDNLSSIRVFAFDNDTNAVIEIEAKKSNVSFPNTTEQDVFRGVKEVKWLNG